MNAKNVHFTTGGPWFEPEWEPKRQSDIAYAAEWKELKKKTFILGEDN
jgi:hypothetical protein